MAAELSSTNRGAIALALQHPRGRYTAQRAAQLSGVPVSTIYDWRRNTVYAPDFTKGQPAMWSYRDLVLLRLLAWLRQGGMERPLAAERVGEVKTRLGNGEAIHDIHATRQDLVFNTISGPAIPDDRENLLPSPDFYQLLGTFDLLRPIEELRQNKAGRLWAPDLLTPSTHSFISPWVLAGDPCVERTRIPTATVYALSTERQLPSDAIAALYPGLTELATNDVITLERCLRGLEDPEQLAA